MNKFHANVWKSLIACSLISMVILFRLSIWGASKIWIISNTNGHPVLSEPEKQASNYRANITDSNILNSVWINYFPHLKKAVKCMTEETPDSITFVQNTRIELENGMRENYNVGDTVNAKIITFDKLRRRKRYGGDFFKAILRRPNSDTDGVSCAVIDHSDGSYSVRCILPWEGDAFLTVELVHPSESILQMMLKYSSEKHYGLDIVTTLLNSKNETEKTICAVGFPDKRPDELCDYTNPSHGEKRTCLKPPSGECSEIVDQAVGEDPTKTKLYDDVYFVKGLNFHTPIQGSGIHLKIVKKSNKNVRLPPARKLSLDPMTPTGFWFNSSWNSIKSSKRIGTDYKTMQECVKNKRLYIFGDSTMRAMYRTILAVLELKDTGLDNTVAWSRGRDAEDKKWNLTMQYRSHGPPLLNPGPEDARPYMSDSFDAIRSGGDGTIIVFSIGYHFHLLGADVFLDRIRIIKRAVIDLVERLPGVKVVIRGLHYHSVDIADRVWLTYRFEILLRNEFKGLKGVTYVESWDHTMVRNSTALHPPPDILFEVISRFLGTVCPSLIHEI